MILGDLYLSPVIGVSDSFLSSDFDGVSFGRACQFQLLQEDGFSIQFLLVYRSVFHYSFFLVQSLWGLYALHFVEQNSTACCFYSQFGLWNPLADHNSMV